MFHEKPLINVAFVGHVDHGKSTLIGRLLHELGIVTERAIEDAKREAIAAGKKTYFYAFLLDKSLTEREKGNTIEISFWEPIETRKNLVKIVDVPGHTNYISNMITGVAQADAAVLVVDVDALLKRGIEKLIGLREHVIALRVLGVEDIIIVMNKIDKLNYSKEEYEKARDIVSNYLRDLEFDMRRKIFVPVSAFHGVNVTKRSEVMSWYEDLTFLQALEKLREPPRQIEKPFRMPITRTFLSGRVPVGVITSGKVGVGDKIMVMPPKESGIVKSIEEWNRRVNSASAGEDIGLRIDGIGRQYFKRGFVIASVTNPPSVATEIRARVVVLNEKGLWVGYAPTIYCHATRANCRVNKILFQGEEKNWLPCKEMGELEMSIYTPSRKGIVIERFRDYPNLGRFALKDGEKTVGVGICIEVLK